MSGPGKRIRSPSYPYFDLETAVTRIRQLYDFAKRSEVLVSDMITEWGYKTPTSTNGMKAVAALKGYNLIDNFGKKDNRKIALTELAYRIIHTAQGTAVRNALIREAALSPPMYSYMWNKYGPLEDMPKDEAIKSHLIIDKKFNETAVAGFLNDYKSTVEYADLKPIDNDNAAEDFRDENEAIDESSSNSSGRTDAHAKASNAEVNIQPAEANARGSIAKELCSMLSFSTGLTYKVQISGDGADIGDKTIQELIDPLDIDDLVAQLNRMKASAERRNK